MCRTIDFLNYTTQSLDSIFQDRYLTSSDQELVQKLSSKLIEFSERTPDSKKIVLLFPVVNSYHRFLIHKVVEGFPELHSFSIGQDPNRRTVVTKVKRIDQEEPWFMSAPRPQSSRGRGRGRAGGQSANNNGGGCEGMQDESQKGSNSVSPAGVNRQRQKKPEVQRYVPRGRRLLNQQEEETRVEHAESADTFIGDNSPITKDDSNKICTETTNEQRPSRNVKKRTKNEVYIPPGRRTQGEEEESPGNGGGTSRSDREAQQFEDGNVLSTESAESLEQKLTDGSEKDRKEQHTSGKEGKSDIKENEDTDETRNIANDSVERVGEQSMNECICDKEEEVEEETMEEGMEVGEGDGVNKDCVDQDKSVSVEEASKEKVGILNESERISSSSERKEAGETMETGPQDKKLEDEDDTPLNWDDDVEEGIENDASKESKNNHSGVKTEVKVQADQPSESKSEVKKIKLKKKKRGKVLNEGKAEEETPAVETKGKKKSTRSNITVFDMMNMHELQEDKDGEKKVETKVETVHEEKREKESVSKGKDCDKEDGEEENDDWDKMFDDDGECLDPSAMDELTKTVGKVKIEKATIDYLDFKPKEQDYDDMNHVIEIYDFPTDFKTEDLLSIFSQFKSKGFDIKWVDDTHALGVFSSVVAAQDALKTAHPLCKVGPLSEASKACKAKARRCVEFLQPYKPRPETTAMTARRLVTGALGIAPKISKEQREMERQKLKEAKEKKRNDRKQREDIWEGTVASNSS